MLNESYDLRTKVQSLITSGHIPKDHVGRVVDETNRLHGIGNDEGLHKYLKYVIACYQSGQYLVKEERTPEEIERHDAIAKMSRILMANDFHIGDGPPPYPDVVDYKKTITDFQSLSPEDKVAYAKAFNEKYKHHMTESTVSKVLSRLVEDDNKIVKLHKELPPLRLRNAMMAGTEGGNDTGAYCFITGKKIERPDMGSKEFLKEPPVEPDNFRDDATNSIEDFIFGGGPKNRFPTEPKPTTLVQELPKKGEVLPFPTKRGLNTTKEVLDVYDKIKPKDEDFTNEEIIIRKTLDKLLSEEDVVDLKTGKPINKAEAVRRDSVGRLQKREPEENMGDLVRASRRLSLEKPDSHLFSFVHGHDNTPIMDMPADLNHQHVGHAAGLVLAAMTRDHNSDLPQGHSDRIPFNPQEHALYTHAYNLSVLGGLKEADHKMAKDYMEDYHKRRLADQYSKTASSFINKTPPSTPSNDN